MITILSASIYPQRIVVWIFFQEKCILLHFWNTFLTYFFIAFCFLTLCLNKVVLLITHAILNFVIFTTFVKCILQKFKYALKIIWSNYIFLIDIFLRLWRNWNATRISVYKISSRKMTIHSNSKRDGGVKIWRDTNVIHAQQWREKVKSYKINW